MAAKPISYYVAPALLVLGTLLAAGNAYLRPERAGPWIVSLLLLGCMALALGYVSRGPKEEAAKLCAADSIRTGVVYAGSILVLTLGATLINAMGVPGAADLSERAMMAILGAFFVFTGNAIPKTLRPLSPLPEDAARVQAFQRFAGWTWVLTGLVFAIAWLILPLRFAESTSFLLLPAAILLILVQYLRLRRTGHRAA
jgi:hypothetical protein